MKPRPCPVCKKAPTVCQCPWDKPFDAWSKSLQELLAAVAAGPDGTGSGEK